MSKNLKELGDLGDRMAMGMPMNQGGAVMGASDLTGFTSPDVSQDPNHFGTMIDKSKLSADSKQSVSKIAPFSPYNGQPPEDFAKDVDSVKAKVTPDEVIMGVDYEMKKLVLKDKQVAKQNVVSNLKKNPKYYSQLNMLDITDEPPEDFRTPQEKAIAEVMRELYQNKLNRINSN